MVNNRPDPAISLLRRIPYDWSKREVAAGYLPTVNLCWCYHLKNDFTKELEAARGAQSHFPNALGIRSREACALVGLGRLEEVERLVESVSAVTPGPYAWSPRSVKEMAVFELRAHGHAEQAKRLAEQVREDILGESPEAQKADREHLAQALLCADRPQEALGIYQGLVTEPQDQSPRRRIILQGRLGATLARLGRKQEAMKIDAGLAESRFPYLWGEPTFWRACIAAQLGEKDRAVDLLRKAIAQGGWSGHFLITHVETILEPLRGYAPYEELMKPKE